MSKWVKDLMLSQLVEVAAAAQVQSLDWERPRAVSVAKKKKKKKKKKNPANKQTKNGPGVLRVYTFNFGFYLFIPIAFYLR